MKVTEKKLADGHIRLEAVAASAEVSHALDLAAQAFAQQMGVRPQAGKTAAQAITEQLGVKDVDGMVGAQAMELLAPFALDKRNLVPAFPPKTESSEPLRRGKPFSFSLTVTPKPVYELEDYSPLSLALPVVEVPQEAVDQQLAQMADSYASYVASDETHPLGRNDAAKISLAATRGGEEMKGLSTEGRTYVMGLGMMPPAFDDELVGMNVGDEKSFTLTLPGMEEDQDKIECTVKVLELQRKEIPALDDQFVANFFPMMKGIDALRGAIEDSMRMQLEQQRHQMALQQASQQASMRFKGRIADEVYEAMRSTLMQQAHMQASQQGMSFEQFMESQGGEQQFGMMLMLQARQMLASGYALDAVFRHEKLSITDDDLMAAAAQLNPQDPAGAKRQMEEAGQGFALREIAERQKANEYLVAHATIKDINPSAPVAEVEQAQAEGGSPEDASAESAPVSGEGEKAE